METRDLQECKIVLRADEARTELVAMLVPEAIEFLEMLESETAGLLPRLEIVKGDKNNGPVE